MIAAIESVKGGQSVMSSRTAWCSENYTPRLREGKSDAVMFPNRGHSSWLRKNKEAGEISGGNGG